MGNAIRILHTADSHIGADLPLRPRINRPRRGDDLVQSFSKVLHVAAEQDVDLVIHCGDLFDTPRPSSRALVAATQPLLHLATQGIPIVIVPGNHERSAMPGALLLSHPNIHIVGRPCSLPFTLRGTTIAVSAFPCLRSGAAERFCAALDETQWTKARADLRILAVHQAFDSARCGPAGYRFRAGDDVVPRSLIPAAFDYVACGHVHRHQELAPLETDGPAVVYAGSPDRVSFAEIDEPKGCVLITQGRTRLSHSFVPHDVRPMSIWPMDVTGMSKAALIEQASAIIMALPPDAIAQLRLTGAAAQGAFRGLRLAGHAARLRPDVLFTVSSRAVEFRQPRQTWARPRRSESAFADIPHGEDTLVKTTPTDLKALPTGCGVYALYDGARRILYIGKSKHLRSRLRGHLNGNSGGNYFNGWARQVNHIESLSAQSDLEAMLIEAELIRRLRPPFNRQLRKWPGYCYLCESDMPYGQLTVCRQPLPRRRCFGPFRHAKQAALIADSVASLFGLAQCPDEPAATVQLPLLMDAGGARRCNRFYEHLCLGPCANGADRRAYANLLRQRNDFLDGADDARLCELEARLAAVPCSEPGSDDEDPWRSRATTLRAAFNHVSALREAERLMHGLLILPGEGPTRAICFLTPSGLRFDRLRNGKDDAQRILACHARMTGKGDSHRSARLPKAVMDAFLIAARERRSGSASCTFLEQGTVRAFTWRDLLAVTVRA